MRKTERYVCYYRMPAIGDTHNGDALERQRRDTACFLHHKNRELVGEFTEVMMPSWEGGTSPAFDLAVACCLELGAKLVCALAEEDLEAPAREKAARSGVEILYAERSSALSVREPDLPRNTEAVPHLSFRHDRRTIAGPETVRAASPRSRSKADRFAVALLPIIDRIRDDGATTLTEIADALNAQNIRTARGRRWYPTTVKNILERLD